MIEQQMWKRSLAALAAVALLGGLAACGERGETADPEDETSFTDGSPDDATDDDTTPTEATTTKDPTEDGGFKVLPACEELSQSIVDGVEITDGEQVDGKSCRFVLGEDPVLGRQLVWIARGGGGWPARFKAEQLNEKMAAGVDRDDAKYRSSVDEIDAPGWAYGVRFDEEVGEVERSSYRLFAFARNGDLLSCHTSVSDADLGAFRDWCDRVLATVQP